MKITVTAYHSDARTVTMTARCRAFTGEPVREHTILCDLNPRGEAVRTLVMDEAAGHYTALHALRAWHLERIYATARGAFQRHEAERTRYAAGANRRYAAGHAAAQTDQHVTTATCAKLGSDPEFWQGWHDGRPTALKRFGTTSLLDPTRPGGWCCAP